MRNLMKAAAVVLLLAGASVASGCAVIGHAIDDAIWHKHHHHKHHRHARHKRVHHHVHIHHCD